MAEELKQTPLHAMHQKYGARMVPFGGWDMPVQYTGVIEEHRAVRTGCGLFDVSHMGEFEFRGPQALAALNLLVTNDCSKLEVGQALYSPMCAENGTMVDDVLIYRLDGDHYWMVVNAGNLDKDFSWVTAKTGHLNGISIRNLSREVAQLALQGPAAERLLQAACPADLRQIGYYRAQTGVSVGPVQALVMSRTGYTGEDGFEIYLKAEDAMTLWDFCLNELGDEQTSVVPCGLGARDTLRFEAGLPLYGHEIDDTTTPLEAGLGTFVKLKKADFIGRDVLAAQKTAGVGRKLVGLEMVGRGIARQGYELMHAGEVVGRVTSGTHCPTLGKAMGLGYVPTALAEPGCELAVVIRGQQVSARVAARPFYRRNLPAGAAAPAGPGLGTPAPSVPRIEGHPVG